MKTRNAYVAAASVCGWLLPVTSSFAQGSLTPPGAPAPMMKTLDQVEARLIVNSNNTPGDATTLFKIARPGSYYLVTNIVGASGLSGIAIESSQVTLDLNGFSLTGVPGSLDGIRNTNPGTVGLSVRNGVIRSWDGDGISGLGGGYGEVFSDLQVLGNGNDGMDVLRATVRDCVAQDNGGDGIFAAESSVAHCSVTGNSTGIQAAFSSQVEGCTVKFNGYGIDIDSGSIAINNTVQASSSCGMLVRTENRVAGNVVTDGQNQAPGILLLAGSGTSNVIDGNLVVNNPGGGIVLTNSGVSGNLVLRNSARGNSTNYQMGAGNSYGPIVNVSGAGDISGTPNANHPAANYSF